MAEKWHDINAPGVWQKPNKDKPGSGSTTPADTADTDAPAQEPEKPLIKLSEGKFVPPAEGAAINKKCPVQVNVEYLDESAKSMQKVTFSLYANYQDAVSNLSHYVDGYEKSGVAQAEMTMYPPPGYKEGDNVDYFFKAEHIRGEKIIDSEDLTLPMETKSIILQKGDYDENGAAAYNKDQSGDNFKPNNVVKKLQGDLIRTIFLPKGSDDGFFGDQTDKALRCFEDYAIKPDRMKQKVGKLEKADKTLEKPQPDGIFDQKTKDELDKWLNYCWIKPIPPLRLGDFDDEGVKNNKGKRGGEDYFQGTLVLDLHKLLATVGTYLGQHDGWFGDITHSALKLFQDHASKGDMVDINGNPIQLPEQDRLKGHTVGVADAPTQEALKQCQEKKIKVPLSTPADPPWIVIARKEIGITQVKTGKTPDRILEYHHATTIAEEWAIKPTTAWCSSFANWVMKQSNYEGSKDAHASSWANWGDKLEKPAFGCIGITSSKVDNSLYHVGFVIGKRTYPPKREGYLLLAGNQGKPLRHVCVAWFSIDELKTFRIPAGYTSLNYNLQDIQGDFSEGNYETTR